MINVDRALDDLAEFEWEVQGAASAKDAKRLRHAASRIRDALEAIESVAASEAWA